MIARVTLKTLYEEDLPLLLAWSFIPRVWEYLPTSRKGEELAWEQHLKWFRSTRGSRFDWLIMVNEVNESPRPVGMAHAVDLDEHFPEIGLYIGEVNLWGKGVGRLALRLTIKAMDKYSHVEGLHAVIHPQNVHSVKLFTLSGFRKVGKARKGQDLYEYTFDRPRGPIPELTAGVRLSYSTSPV